MKKSSAVSLISVILILTLSACGGGLSGTYVDESGTISLEFSGNKITTDMMGYKQEGTFETKDDILYMTDEDNDVTEAEYKLDGKILTIDGIEYTKK